MGVKDLWTILSPVSEKKSLWILQNKPIAIDLSAWICDSQNVGDHSQRNMYLRNLFFRTSFLLLNNCKPIFVLDGDAPELKHQTIVSRIEARGGKNVEKSSRSRLKSLQKQCKQLLTIMGVPCVQAPGEAEAFCAWLNQTGVVEAVITQDSDCFLYGGRVILRNFMLSPQYTCEEVDIDKIESKLSLGRYKLMAFSLLCGCDYIKGVSGIGKESAMKFLSTIEEYQVLRRFREWRSDPYYEVLESKGLSQLSQEQKLELNIRKKALQDPDFPSEEIIKEFLSPVTGSGVVVPELKWSKPDLPAFVKLADIKLTWEDTYAVEKFLPLLTRWHLINDSIPSPIKCTSIVKKRVVRGMNCFEVRWTADFVFESEDIELVTVEPQDLIQNAYRTLFDQYTASKIKPKKVTRKKKDLPSAAAVDEPEKAKKQLKDITNVSDLLHNLSFEEKPTKKQPNKKRIKSVKGLQTIDKFLAEYGNRVAKTNKCEDVDDKVTVDKVKDDNVMISHSSIRENNRIFSPLLQSTPNKIHFKVNCLELDVSDHFTPEKDCASVRRKRNEKFKPKNNLSLLSDAGNSHHQVSQRDNGVDLSLFDLYDNDEINSFEMSAIINGIVSRKNDNVALDILLNSDSDD